MESRTVVICSKCNGPLVSGEGFGFAWFKIPGQEGITSSTAGFLAGIAGKFALWKTDKSRNGSEGAPVVNWP